MPAGLAGRSVPAPPILWERGRAFWGAEAILGPVIERSRPVGVSGRGTILSLIAGDCERPMAGD